MNIHILSDMMHHNGSLIKKHKLIFSVNKMFVGVFIYTNCCLGQQCLSLMIIIPV